MRLRYVRSPWSLTAPQVPASVASDAGMTPAATACLNGLRRNGEKSSSSLPAVSMSHSPSPIQSRYVCWSALTASMKRRLFTPVIENITDADIISSRGVLWTGAPARATTSASPVASTTRRARFASRPALLSVITPAIDAIPQDRRDERTMQHRQHPGFLHQHVRDVLEHFGIERMTDRRGSGIAGPSPWPVPRTDSDAFAVDRPFVPDQANPSTPTWVMLPPKQPLRSRSVVCRAGAGRRQRCREAAGPAAHDEAAVS